MPKNRKISTTSCYKECPSIKMRLKTTSMNDKNTLVTSAFTRFI